MLAVPASRPQPDRQAVTLGYYWKLAAPHATSSTADSKQESLSHDEHRPPTETHATSTLRLAERRSLIVRSRYARHRRSATIERPLFGGLAVVAACLAITLAVRGSEPVDSGWNVAKPTTALDGEHADDPQIPHRHQPRARTEPGARCCNRRLSPVRCFEMRSDDDTDSPKPSTAGDPRTSRTIVFVSATSSDTKPRHRIAIRVRARQQTVGRCNGASRKRPSTPTPRTVASREPKDVPTMTTSKKSSTVDAKEPASAAAGNRY